MNKSLSPKDIHEIKKLAKTLRAEYGNSPLGEQIFQIVKSNDIHIFYYPIKFTGENDNPFRAVYLSPNGTEKDKVRFIAINTYDFLDSILFAIAHELYHYTEDAIMDIYRNNDEDSNEIRELKANRFAAELLLPEDAVMQEVAEWNNGLTNLIDWDILKILRFIAYLHCHYWAPFKCIVIRLFETNCIDEETVKELLVEDARDGESRYYKIADAVNRNIFQRLNERINKIGMDYVNLEVLLNNYELGIVSTNEISKDLEIFGTNLGSYGLDEKVEEEDLEELKRLFEDFENDSK
ncbi:ImmA/IrrE family metallo-endopeptidase [Gottfriedia sp. NPDC057991]|uniref:ImmA/IrrE family metallo-endopeptidase n=1 Tax=Gottfriedia sp. NPDC057991 TaxID=3346298 RepID=UPI0036DC1D4A